MIEELRAQQQKQQAAIVRPTSYPCLLQVMKDSSLNTVLELGTDPVHVGAFDGGTQ